MNTQHNEMMQALDVFTAERDRLREVNAELLAALEAAVDCGPFCDLPDEVQDQVKAAILKARGE